MIAPNEPFKPYRSRLKVVIGNKTPPKYIGVESEHPPPGNNVLPEGRTRSFQNDDELLGVVFMRKLTGIPDREGSNVKSFEYPRKAGEPLKYLHIIDNPKHH